MLRKLYDWTIDLSAHPHAVRWLAAIAFFESVIFPVPTAILLAPLCLAARGRALRLAAIATVFSVIGGIAGYFVGAYLFEAVGQPIVEMYGYEQAFQSFRETYDEWGLAIVFTAGLTPLPYKVFTIASGVAGMNLPLFILGSVVSRAAQFFIIGGLFWKFGAPIQSFIEQRLAILTILVTVLIIAGFVAIKYMG